MSDFVSDGKCSGESVVAHDGTFRRVVAHRAQLRQAERVAFAVGDVLHSFAAQRRSAKTHAEPALVRRLRSRESLPSEQHRRVVRVHVVVVFLPATERAEDVRGVVARGDVSLQCEGRMCGGAARAKGAYREERIEIDELHEPDLDVVADRGVRVQLRHVAEERENVRFDINI